MLCLNLIQRLVGRHTKNQQTFRQLLVSGHPLNSKPTLQPSLPSQTPNPPPLSSKPGPRVIRAGAGRVPLAPAGGSSGRPHRPRAGRARRRRARLLRAAGPVLGDHSVGHYRRIRGKADGCVPCRAVPCCAVLCRAVPCCAALRCAYASQHLCCMWAVAGFHAAMFVLCIVSMTTTRDPQPKPTLPNQTKPEPNNRNNRPARV